MRGATGAGWDGLRDRCGLEVCGCGLGKIFKLLWVSGRFKFYGGGADADTKFQPVQDSTQYVVSVLLFSFSVKTKNMVTACVLHIL